MTQSLALIEGELGVPLPRPYDGLPPPFGSRHTVEREVLRQAVREVANATKPGMLRPALKHIFLYQTPSPRIDTERWDAALAEAKRYLAHDAVRPRSSRSDHRLAASIFAGSSIALAWLLVTYSMKGGEQAKPMSPVATAYSAVNSLANLPKLVARWLVGDAQNAAGVQEISPQIVSAVTNGTVKPASSTDAPLAASVSSAAPAAALPLLAPDQVRPVVVLSPTARKHTAQVFPRRTVQVSVPDDDVVASPAKSPKRVKMARLSKAHVQQRVALSHALRPAARASVSKQPEWAAGSAHSHNDALTDSAPWLNWSAQPHRTSANVSRAVPKVGDSNWNDHMTQRRITDDPAAFHVRGSAQ